MSHDIEQSDDGRATFVAVKRHGWHQLGTLSEKELSVKEGLDLAHLADREYHLEPIYASVDGQVISGGDWRAVVRRHPFTDEWQMLGAGMGKGFAVHTPEEVFAFGEELIQQGKPLAALGSINNGRRAFAAFKADEITIGGVDQIRMFLNVMTAFDGSMSTMARASSIRVECENTFNAVLGENSAPTYRVRHTGGPLSERVDDAMAALKIGFKGMEVFQAEAEALIDRDVTDQTFAKIVEQLLPIKDDAQPAARTKTYEARTKVHTIYNGPTVKKIRGTGWGALNAFTEYLDWTGGNYASPEQRMVAQITPGSAIDTKRLMAAKVVGKAVGLARI